jgi:hypothetical protein
MHIFKNKAVPKIVKEDGSEGVAVGEEEIRGNI